MRTISMLFGNVKLPEQDPQEIKDEINSSVESGTINEAIQSAIGENKERYLIASTTNVSETQVSSWDASETDKNIGIFTVAITVRDKVTNTVYSLKNLLSFDYLNAPSATKDNTIVTDSITLTLGVSAGGKLQATVSGMPVNDKSIFFCFERCVLGIQEVFLRAFGHFVLGGSASLSAVIPVEDGCYGYLYNWFTVDDTRKITSSDSWIVSTQSEWIDLYSYLGTPSDAGGKLKETGLDYWNAPNAGATNEVFFNARGNSRRESDGLFAGTLKGNADWWFGDASNFSRVYASAANISLLASSFDTEGKAVRLTADATGIPDGTQTTYTGNDGKVYPAIAINQKYWLQQNLEETQYRNGDPIYNVEDNTTWAGLTEGALCLYDNNETYACKTPLPQVPCYGYLYNQFIVDGTGTNSITSSDDWRIPLYNGGGELFELINYVGDFTTAGGILKKDGVIFWDSPNSSTDAYGLGVKGGGSRSTSGVFAQLKTVSSLWSGDTSGATRVAIEFDYNNNGVNAFSNARIKGHYVRLVKDATGLPDGTTTTYTGNDGKTYNAIVINELYWTTENLEETEYRNGDPIPNVTDNTAWSNLTTGAWCTYNNLEEYKCK